MIFLFIVNVIVLTLVAREFCQKVTEENPSEGTREEEVNTRGLPPVELTTEEELVTKKTSQEETQENPSPITGTELKTWDPIDVELVTKEDEVAKGPIKTGQEMAKEVSRETTDEPGKAQKRTHSADNETCEEENKENFGKLPKEQVSGEQNEETDMEMIPQGEPFYELKAAATAMWLPAVVGDKKNLFLSASLSTQITKILMLVMSFILAFFFQEKLHPHPFILWSRVGKMFN